MSFRRVFVVLTLAIASTGCGLAQTDVKAAREARYQGDTAEIFGALVDVVGRTYAIQDASPERLEIQTMMATAADGTSLAYSVVLTPSQPHRVQVLTHVQRDDGEDPPWVAERTERLIVAIHERLAAYQVRVDPGAGWR